MLGLLQWIAAEGPNGRFIPSDVKELYWGGAAFLIILYFIVTKAVPLAREALEKGQQDAVADATAAEQALADAQARIAEASAELGDADAESERIIAEAHEAAQQLVNDSAERTQQLVDDMWARAQNDVESMKAQAVADIQAEVAAQAVGAAEEVVRSSLDASGQNDLIESYISGLGASS